MKDLNCSYRDQKKPPKNKPEIKVISHPRIQTSAEKYQSLTPNELISPRSFSLLNQSSWRCGILVSHQVHNHEHWGATVCFYTSSTFFFFFKYSAKIQSGVCLVTTHQWSYRILKVTKLDELLLISILLFLLHWEKKNYLYYRTFYTEKYIGNEGQHKI